MTPRPLRSASDVVRVLLGSALIVVGVGLLCWGLFPLLRGPSSCGGPGYAPCPEGFGLAISSVFAGLFPVLPIGVLLVYRHFPNVISATTALVLGGAAATVYSSRFVAEPVVSGTVGTWAAVVPLAVLAGLAALRALFHRPSLPSPGAVSAALGATAPSAPADRPPKSPAVAPPAGASTAGTASISDLQRLIFQGLANGQLGSDTVTSVSTQINGQAVDAQTQQQVARLLDLHQQGTIGKEELRRGLLALRPDKPSGAVNG